MQTKARVYSYSYLTMAAEGSLKQARKSKGDPFFECMSALLFSALAMEAFLNHAGSQILPRWDILKKKLSPKEKLDLIFAVKGIEVDWGSRPYQSFIDVIKYRNMLAHAETEDVKPEIIFSAGSSPNHWHAFCKIEFAEKISSDISRIIKEMPLSLGFSVPPDFLLAECVANDD